MTARAVPLLFCLAALWGLGRTVPCARAEDAPAGPAAGAADSNPAPAARAEGEAGAGEQQPQGAGTEAAPEKPADSDGEAEGEPEASDAKREDAKKEDEKKEEKNDGGKDQAAEEDRVTVMQIVFPSFGGDGGRFQRLPVRGSLRFLYRLRTTGDDSDNDMYQYLQVHVGDERAPGWSGSFHGRLTEELDGRGDSGEFFVFDSITDTYDSPVTGRLYEAYVSFRPGGGAIERVRVGRQFLEGGDLFHMDGIRVDAHVPGAQGLRATFYGGLPAHIYEGSPEGDLIAGLSLEGSWRGGLARVDYVHLEDETGYYGDTVNDIVTLTVRQRLNPAAAFWASYQQIGAEPTWVRASFDGHLPQHDVSVRAAFYALLNRKNERVNEFDPYFAVVQQLERFWDGTLAVTKGFGRHFLLEGGVAVRRLFDDADEGRYNHSFERYYLTASTDDWPAPGVVLSLTGEHWESDDDYQSVGFEIQHRPSKQLRLEAGTDYALYRFDLYTADERQSVRGYFFRVRFAPNRHWRFHVHLRVEEDDFDTYVTLRTGFDLEL